MSQEEKKEPEMAEEKPEPEYPACHTLYIKNLNERVKLDGKTTHNLDS